MAEYIGTHGSKIQNYTTDPDNPNTGQVWYNGTDNVLKFQFPAVTTTGSWRTANPVNNGRNSGGGFGIYTSALFFGGSPNLTSSEVWNNPSNVVKTLTD